MIHSADFDRNPYMATLSIPVLLHLISMIFNVMARSSQHVTVLQHHSNPTIHSCSASRNNVYMNTTRHLQY
jgi:hypothetical protein